MKVNNRTPQVRARKLRANSMTIPVGSPIASEVPSEAPSLVLLAIVRLRLLPRTDTISARRSNAVPSLICRRRPNIRVYSGRED